MLEDRYNLPIINSIELFPVVTKALIELLNSLSKADWEKETVLPGRTVKDLAAHILDGSLRRLSFCRDDYHAENPDIKSNEDLVEYIQLLNKRWINAFKIVSPKLLISFLEISEPQVHKYLSTLKNEDKANFPVTWAGESESENWFDIAREYTEKWHHQMQIRLAVNKPGLDSAKLVFPVIDTFMRGLPNAYKPMNADNGSCIEIVISGNGGGKWFLEKSPQQWQIVKEITNEPITKITMSDSIAWRLFTDSIESSVAKEEIRIEGDEALGMQIFKLRTVLR